MKIALNRKGELLLEKERKGEQERQREQESKRVRAEEFNLNDESSKDTDKNGEEVGDRQTEDQYRKLTVSEPCSPK